MPGTLRRSLQVFALVALATLTASPVSAVAPERFGPNTYDYTFIGFNCDGFDIEIAGAGADRAVVFFDGSGEITKVTYYGRFPHDVMTNTVTGRSIVVRGEFQELIVRTPAPTSSRSRSSGSATSSTSRASA